MAQWLTASLFASLDEKRCGNWCQHCWWKVDAKSGCRYLNKKDGQVAFPVMAYVIILFWRCCYYPADDGGAAIYRLRANRSFG